LTLIVRDRRSVVGLMTIMAEPCAGGWRFDGFIPWRAMP
jgi:hypothetical protein